MANFRVFNDNANELLTKIYGVDGNNPVAVAVDGSGNIGIQGTVTASITNTVTVEGTVTVGNTVTVQAESLSIRALNNDTDNILVYGYDGVDNQPIATDTAGVLLIKVNDHAFANLTETLSVNDTVSGGASRDISNKTVYTFAAQNTDATHTAEIVLQISPNGTDWLPDTSSITLGPSGLTTLVNKTFLQYARIYARCTSANTIELATWFQAQS